MRYWFLILLLGFLLSACAGFEPIHGTRQGDVTGDGENVRAHKLLNRIHFETTQDREGQVLYTAFYEQLKTLREDETPLYILKVTDLDIERYNIGIAADETSRLDQIIAKAEFSLTEVDTAEEISNFDLRLVSTYNVVGADAYSTELTFQSTRDRLLQNMAEQVRLRLLADLTSR